ncbi:hypothetical protein BH10BAC3_BH10BAC3_09740 [soil metagenome]
MAKALLTPSRYQLKKPIGKRVLPFSSRVCLLFFFSFFFLKATAYTVDNVTVSSQSATLTYGTGGSVSYTITLGMITGPGVSTDLTLNWTPPTGVTSAAIPTTALTGNGQTVTFSVNTTNLTPAGNYSFTVTSSDGPVISGAVAFAVFAKPLLITAATQNKSYGTTLTGGAGFLAFASAGLENSETIGSVSLAFGTGAAANAAVTTYTGSITPSAAAGGSFNPSNYAISYVTGDIIVDPATLTITADNANKFYGNILTGGPGATTFTHSALQNGETIGSVTLSYGTGAAANAGVGTYTGFVTPSAPTGGTFDPANYSITYISGNIIVNQAGLTITADNVSKPYGTTLSGGAGSTAFTIFPVSLPNGETIGSITIGYGAGAASNAAVGLYTLSVVPSAASGPTFNAANYSITYTAGNITVTNAGSAISVASNLNPACIGSNVTLTATISSVLSNVTGTVTFLDGATSLGTVTIASNQAALSLTTLPVGSRSITAVYSGDANYATSTSSVLTQVISGNPTVSGAGTDQTGSSTCGLTAVTLGANAPAVGTGAWSVATGTGGSFGNSSSPTSTFSGIAGNSYTLRWTITNGPCLASPSDMSVTFNIIPSVTQPAANQPVCANSSTNAINFTGTGTTYSWTNSQSVIGLPLSGTGNITSFTALNAGNSDIVASIIVTPLGNSCSGATKTFTITVKPRPVVTAAPSAQTICSGTNITAIGLTSNVATGTNTYAWTRDNIAGLTGGGGLTAFSGTGNSISGSFTSTLTAQGTVGLHATATNNGCTGLPTDFAVTVNPVATVNSITSQTVCNGTNTTAVSFLSPNATSYSWSNNNLAIGLASGPTPGNNIAAFAGTNAGLAPIFGTVTVTPVYTSGISCNGIAGAFTITVNPTPSLSSTLAPSAICSNTMFNYTPATNATGVIPTFTWTRAVAPSISNPAASGTGNISETLINTSTSNKPVTYFYTVSATNNSVTCINPTTFSVVETVKDAPTITFSSPSNQNTCTGSAITPVNLIFQNGTSFTWVRDNILVVTGIATPGSGNNSGTISGTLQHSQTDRRSTVFTITATKGGCSRKDSFEVKVYPPIINNIILVSQVSQVSICGLLKQVTIATPPPQGGNGSYTYQWQESADNVVFTNIAGATGSTLVYPNADAFSNYYFRRIVNSVNCSDISLSYHIAPVTGTASYITGACTGGSGMDIWVIASYLGANYTLQKYNTTTTLWDNVASKTGDGDSLNFDDNKVLGDYRVVASIPGPPACQVIVDSTVTINANTLPANPSATSVAPSAICSGTSANIFATVADPSGISGPAVTWYIVPTSGSPIPPTTPTASGSPFSVSPSITTTYYAKSIYTVTGCKSSGRTPVTVTVNPAPVMTSAAAVAVCGGNAVNLSFTNNTDPAATYSWVATANANVGGESTSPVTGSTLNDVLTNTTTTSQTVTYTVTSTVSATGCLGSPQIVLVTVDPKPAIGNQAATVCSGAMFTISPVNTITSPVTQYAWAAPTGSGFTGGLAGSGTSISGTLTNTTNSQATATYNIVPSGGVCTGNPFTATVTINPKPSIVNQGVVVCNGSFSIPPFIGVANIIPAGTTYSWLAPTGTNISGMAASGTPQPNVFGNNLVNTAPSIARTATYTVTPTAPAGMGGCIGSNFTVVATIHPIPSATINGNATVCQAPGSTNVTFTGAGGTAPYTFTYNINGGGSVTTLAGNPVSVAASIATAGTFTYNLVGMTDAANIGCLAAQSGSVVVTVNPLPVINAQSIKPCSGTLFSLVPVDGSPTAPVVPAGTTYNWPIPVLPAGVTGASAGTAQPGFSQTLINNSGTAQTIIYTLTPLAGTCPGSSFTVTVSLDPAVGANTAIWTGSVNSDWCNTANWACGIIPDINKNAIIPAGTSNQPVITGTCDAYVKDLDLQGTATLNLAAGRGLSIYGEVINPATPLRYTLNGTVTFAGVNQQIPGFTYNGLIISGGGIKTLSGPATVNGNLSLNNGIVVSSNAAMLTTGVSAVVSQASVSPLSYIQGPLTRLTNSTGTYTFPVGGGGAVRNAYVIPVTNTLSSYTVYYHNSSPTINAVLNDLAGVQKNEYWDIIRNSGANAVVGMDYKNPNGLAAGATTTDWSSTVNPCGACNVAVVYGDAVNKWDFTGAPGTGFGPNEATYWQSDNTVYSKLQSTFGQFSFGYAYSIILPVKLISFTGALSGDDALLNWSFAPGNDMVSTELHHGTNGQQFVKLVNLAAVAGINNYNYIHANLQSGPHYYRLLIKDKAGKTTYSATILLVTGKNITVIKGIRPTLVQNETFVDIHSAKIQTLHAIVFDIGGRSVAEYRGSLQQGENTYRIPTTVLAKGLYTVQVKTADGVMANLRFLKE